MSEKDLQGETVWHCSLQAGRRSKQGYPVTDEEVQKYYEENPSLFEQPGGIEISILVKDESCPAILEKAQEEKILLNWPRNIHWILQGAGGELGPINEDVDLVPEFKEAALA